MGGTALSSWAGEVADEVDTQTRGPDESFPIVQRGTRHPVATGCGEASDVGFRPQEYHQVTFSPGDGAPKVCRGEIGPSRQGSPFGMFIGCVSSADDVAEVSVSGPGVVTFGEDTDAARDFSASGVREREIHSDQGFQPVFPAGADVFDGSVETVSVCNAKVGCAVSGRRRGEF